MKKPGFSLLETTVAVAILIIAVVGPLTLASTSIKSFSQAKNGLLAASLAQEGIELIRNYRSSNVLGGRNWLFGMNACLTPNSCKIDAVTSEIDSCGASCPALNLASASGLYSYGAGTPTIFIRKITLETIGTDEVKIKSKVSWEERFGQQSFELEEYMLNWQ
ncbi:MAG: type II secretion system protein [Candidatus Giovannonibacteria bacterium]|nr:MAG: type II secretion system protein [Candidatus Giovannonibacteria bacterium]